MKNLFAACVLLSSLTSGLGQGLINFYNTPSTLVSVTSPVGILPISGQAGGFEFALLTSPAGANNFSFAGVYGTNTTTPGIFSGGGGVAVPGWATGTARDFVVFGWGVGNGGLVYNPSWLKPNLSYGSNMPMLFGLSDGIANGVAGGVTGSGTVPTLNIFGGPSGIQSGFTIGGQLVPEPSSVALMGLGAGVFLLRYLRKQRTR